MKVNADGSVVFETVEDLRAEMKKVAADATEAIVKEMKLNAPAAPTIFTGIDLAGREKEKRYGRIVASFKALATKDYATYGELVKQSYAEAKYKVAGGLSEGVNADGAFLTTVDFSNELIATLETYGSARRNCTIVPMTTNVKNLNSLTGKVTAYIVGEGAAATGSKPQFGRPVLTANKIMGYTIWTSELFEDSLINTVDNLIRLFAEAFGLIEDTQFYNGTTLHAGILGAGMATTNTPCAGASVTPANITYDNLLDCTVSLSPGQLGVTPGVVTTGLQNASWKMHRTVFAVCREVKDTQNRPITSDATAAVPPTLLGYPVEFSEVMPLASAVGSGQKFAVFGNLKPWCYFGDRRAPRSKIVDQATLGSDKLAEQDEEALVVTERIAQVIGVPANIACLVTA